MRLIDADALKEHYNVPDAEGVFSYCDTIMQVIDSQPTIDAEPVRHGRWIPRAAYEECSIAYCDYECSECGHEITKRVLCVPPRCENCGAKMDGGE